MKEVYLIISPTGGVGINMFTGKGTVYANKEKAEKELQSKNEWSKSKGYGLYELIPLIVLEDSE